MKQKDWLYIESDYYRWTRISRNNGGGKFFHLKIIILPYSGVYQVLHIVFGSEWQMQKE